MKIQDLKLNAQSEITDVQCKMYVKQNFVKKDGQVEQTGENKFRFITEDMGVDFKVIDQNIAKQMTDMLSRHYICLATVTNSNGGEERKNFFLHMGFFFDVQYLGKIPIILSDAAKEDIQKRFVRGRRQLEDVMRENFYMTNGSAECFAYFSRALVDYSEDNVQEETKEQDDTSALQHEEKAFEGESDNKENKSENQLEHNESTSDDKISELKNRVKVKEKNKKNSFIIYGQDFAMYSTIEGEGFNEKLYVYKVSVIKKEIPMLRLGIGTLEFTDSKAILSKKIKETLENTKGYLDLWDQYADREGQILLEKARKIGFIQLARKSFAIDEDGIYIPYKGVNEDKIALIQRGDYLLFSETEPVYLSNMDLTWQGYRLMSNEAAEIGYSLTKGALVQIIDKRDGGLILKNKVGEEIPDAPYISISIRGDEEQIIRRENARKRIAEGTSANPALGLILEGQLTEHLDGAKNNRIAPLSSFVEEKIFVHSPTETQKRAIDIALNTPDIAIIQGPPGTGKTTVITAIIERLNEICDKRNPVSGQVLITSFQHDAVRNVIRRLKVNSLPTLKFGKQNKNDEEDLTGEEVIEKWCEDYAQKLEKQNPEVAETEQLAELERLHNIYLKYPNDFNAIQFLRCAKKINLSVELDKRISGLIELKDVGYSADNNKLLESIRRLRTTKAGFLDDGAEAADNLLYELEKAGINNNIDENKRIFNILDDAAECNNDVDEQMLQDLQGVKTYLLKKCTPRPSYSKDVIDDRVLEIYKKIKSTIKKYDNETVAILAELLQELRCNRSEVEKSLEHYLFVYSATTGQSEGKDIKLAKGMDRYSKEHPEYETVVVDEAARVSPPDLMIPLSQARRRIILVGDHRQLPHIYDEEVFETLKEHGEDLDMRNVQKSMFQYMLEKAKELEKKDHIQRTITLDSQYRMHPVLGEFVNEVFYEPHDEHFDSPMPDEHYIQNLTKKNIPIEWYHIPETDASKSEKKMQSGSRIRECEADFIVEKIGEYMESDEGQDLTYGIISFYREQVSLIKKKLKAKLKEKADKVQVGSVDAFQGMEFDVIFLSVVRSNNKKPVSIIEGVNMSIDYNFLKLNYREEDDLKEVSKKWKEYLASGKVDYELMHTLEISADSTGEEIFKKFSEYKQIVGLQNYGFLTSENRLCVSLSRQKRLLIVVGNADIFTKGEWSDLAEICVTGMKRLYELCEKEGVVYDGNTKGI